MSSTERRGRHARRRSPSAISALTSLGRQLPPNPHPASRRAELGPAPARRPAKSDVRYRDMWTPRITSTTSTSPTAAHRFAISFANEMHRRQQRIRGVLDHLRRRVFVRNRVAPREERRVQLVEGRVCRLVDPPQDEPIRRHEVRDGLPLGEELRVHADAEVASRSSARSLLEQRHDDTVGRAGDHGALDHHACGTRPARESHGRLHVSQRHAPRDRCPPAVEGVPTAMSVRSGLATASTRSAVARSRLADVAGEELVSPLSWTGGLPALIASTLSRIHVGADDHVPESARHAPVTSADVPGADDRDPHLRVRSARFSAYQSSERSSPSSSPTIGS